jgi:hypothetical protein
VIIMRLVLNDSKYTFTVTRAAEPKTEFGSGKQKMNRASQLPEWVVEVLAMDSERGEVIRVTVAGDQPKVNQGQPVRFKRAILQPMQHLACGTLPGVRGGVAAAGDLADCAELFFARLAASMSSP